MVFSPILIGSQINNPGGFCLDLFFHVFILFREFDKVYVFMEGNNCTHPCSGYLPTESEYVSLKK